MRLQLFLLHIDHLLTQEQIKHRVKSWPVSEQRQVLSFIQQPDYNASFWSRILLQEALSQLKLPFEWKQLQYSEKGRPFLLNKPLDFNLSHSGVYVFLGIDSHKIGVDIEKHRTVKYQNFNRQFSPQELRQIESADEPQKEFFRLWSVKEAVIKADGRGMAVLSRTHIYTDTDAKIDEMTWFYQSLHELETYSMAVCSERPFESSQAKIKRLYTTDLLKKMEEKPN